MTGSITSTDPDVIDAVTGQRLAAWSVSADSDVARYANRTCANIGRLVGTEVRGVVAWLAECGHGVTVQNPSAPRQRHDVRVDVASFAEADAVANALSDAGFERWDQWSGGAAESFRHFAEQITVARTDGYSFVVRLRWKSPSAGGRLRRLVRSVVRPTHGDWSMVQLPGPLWPLYSVVRPIRLVLERTGRRDPHASGLGPFLSTPQSLIDPLFALAELTEDDTLLDVGCGDGRLAIAAAERLGCRAVGVELDADLVDRARRAARQAGVENLVAIEHGDARAADLSTVTVAFMFLPMDVAAELIDTTLASLPPGARLIIHEQTPLAQMTQPDESHAVISADAVTVAHRWNASEQQAGSRLEGSTQRR